MEKVSQAISKKFNRRSRKLIQEMDVKNVKQYSLFFLFNINIQKYTNKFKLTILQTYPW